MIKEVNFSVGDWKFNWNHEQNMFYGYNSELNIVIEGRPSESGNIYFEQAKQEINEKLKAITEKQVIAEQVIVEEQGPAQV